MPMVRARLIGRPWVSVRNVVVVVDEFIEKKTKTAKSAKGASECEWQSDALSSPRLCLFLSFFLFLSQPLVTVKGATAAAAATADKTSG